MRSRMFRVTSTGEIFLLRMSSLNSVRLRNARSFVCERFCMRLSERRNRIHRRSGAAPDRQRRGRQQELPSFACSGSGAQSFKIAVVDQVDSQGNESEVMNRADNIRWRNILWMIGSQYGDILPLQPRNYRRIEAGILAARCSPAQIGPNFLPPRPDAGTDEHGVAG